MIELLHGDCLELMKDIPDKSIDMILCDLPYGTTACKWDVIIPFEPLWTEYKRVIKDRGCIALFGSEPFSSYLRMSNIKQFKYDWIWEKNVPVGFVTSSYMPMKNHEIISIFVNNGKPKYNKQYVKSKIVDRKLNVNNGKRKEALSDIYGKLTNKNNITLIKDMVSPRTILSFDCSPRSKGYLIPTQKPIDLLEYLIKTYTDENETVLDNCMGSGSTGVACINTNRNFIGIEKEEKYFEIAKNRIEQVRQEAEPKV